MDDEVALVRQPLELQSSDVGHVLHIGQSVNLVVVIPPQAIFDTDLLIPHDQVIVLALVGSGNRDGINPGRRRFKARGFTRSRCAGTGQSRRRGSQAIDGGALHASAPRRINAKCDLTCSIADQAYGKTLIRQTKNAASEHMRSVLIIGTTFKGEIVR